MKETLSTVTGKGQVTIPIEIRADWDLKPKDKVIFEREGEKIVIRPAASTLMAGFGAVAPKRRPTRRRIESAVSCTRRQSPALSRSAPVR
jgi:AbrB family looped-hinge helix DNA binding protein